MTPLTARTAAGRALYSRWSGAAFDAAGDQGLAALERDILAIEAEAASPSAGLRAALQRLVDEHWERQHSSWETYCIRESMRQARAALASGEEGQ